MKIRSGFVLREMCGENIVAGEGLEHINFNKLISLNQTAAFLWKKLEGKEFTEQEMADLLVEEYGIDMELALTDSRNLCKAWIEAGLAE
ncbi:MAG: PqqD family protein [Bacteroidales bacterium]|nr:PqqD family protein [Bacteroidales bacterium]